VTRTRALALLAALLAALSPHHVIYYTDYLIFLRATAVAAVTAEARISYGNSVCLSVCPSQPGAETTE